MKYILSLFIALWSIAAWGQEGGDGFNPSNPGEPGQRYNLTVNVTPDEAGSTSPSGKQQYALGESVYLSANANNYYQFVGWIQDGDINFPQPLFQLYHAGKEYGHNRCVQSYR